MRPIPGGDTLPSAKPRSRKSSLADPSAVSSHVPTAFFMKSEEEMEQSLASSRRSEPPTRQHDSTFGVQSLADTLEVAFGHQSRGEDGKSDDASRHAFSARDKTARSSNGSPRSLKKETESCKSSPTRLSRGTPSNNTLSNPPVPLYVESRSPAPTSAMSSTPRSLSVQSLKLSDEDPCLDEVASQAVASSEEEEESTMGGSSFPQLVMPSLQMPARRAFTAKGKAMGKLKLLVAGEAGIGKTSLIRSIVQICDDIVHVDDLAPSSSMSQPASPLKSKTRKRKLKTPGTTRITEIHASTKSYPSWWTETEESRASRRRKSSLTSDAVLERNICFVDTPGYRSGSKTDDISHVIDYVESQLYQTTSVTTLDDSDLVGVISGSGGISVDVVLYLLPPSHDISDHVEYMQRLSKLTNVIPIIARSDTLSRAEVIAIKTSILARVQTTSIRPFLFGTAIDDALLAIQGLSEDEPPPASSVAVEPKQFPFTVPTHPYAVSSTLGSDTDMMDASLLMSPDYVQPLLPSELATLVDRLFDPDSIAWLRHSAAKKFLAWRRRTKLPGDSFILDTSNVQLLKRGSVSSASVGFNGAALNTSAGSSMFSATSPSGVLVPHVGSPFYTSNLQSPFPASSPSLSHTHLDTLADQNPTDFQLARYQNAVHGEQRLAEVRLAKWATDLQRSLRNERERYDELQRTERAKWLLERVGEEVTSGNIIASPTGGSPRADWAVTRHSRDFNKETNEAMQRYGKAKGLDSRDPLGLCDFSDGVRRKGFVLVKVLGGVSVIGAFMVTAVRVSGWEMGVPEGGVWGWLFGGTGE